LGLGGFSEADRATVPPGIRAVVKTVFEIFTKFCCGSNSIIDPQYMEIVNYVFLYYLSSLKNDSQLESNSNDWETVTYELA
jgi:hypothetical protein